MLLLNGLNLSVAEVYITIKYFKFYGIYTGEDAV